MEAEAKHKKRSPFSIWLENKDDIYFVLYLNSIRLYNTSISEKKGSSYNNLILYVMFRFIYLDKILEKIGLGCHQVCQSPLL